MWIFFVKFSSNALNGCVDKVRARARRSLLRRSLPLPSDREIPGIRHNLEAKV